MGWTRCQGVFSHSVTFWGPWVGPGVGTCRFLHSNHWLDPWSPGRSDPWSDTHPTDHIWSTTSGWRGHRTSGRTCLPIHFHRFLFSYLFLPSSLPSSLPFFHPAFIPFPSILYPSLHFLSLGLTNGPTRGPRDTHCAHGRTRGRTMGARARERGNEFKGPPPRARRGESGHSFQEVTSSSGSEEHVYELRART